MNDLIDLILNPIKKIKQNEVLPLHEPYLIGNEQQYVTECIQTGWVSSVGKFVDTFEQKLGEYTGVTNPVAVVNGTSALHLALLLMEVKSNEEVLTPALTFVATSNAISYVGAIPHFIDSGKSDLSVCPFLLDAYLEETVEIKNNQCINIKTGRKISALIVMHALGHPAKIEELKKITQKFHLKLIEDAAESVGSFYKGNHTGTFGDIGIFSFNGNKIMTTGNGGALVSHDKELMKKAKHLSTTAKTNNSFFFHDEIGYNYRLSNINAALGVAQLEQLSNFLNMKKKLANYYKKYFDQFERIRFIIPNENSISNYWLCGIQLINYLREELLEVLNIAQTEGIMLRPLWTLNNELPMFQHAPSMPLENAKKHVDSVICLPSSASLAQFIN